ncbi:hypothetical protein UlMin_041533 [Ulmus minor]
MEANLEHRDHYDEEEFVLLDLNVVFGQLEIPPNAPYVLSVCLDTLNLVLTIANNLKLVGEYKETIGTCLVFTEESEELRCSTSHRLCGSDRNSDRTSLGELQTAYGLGGREHDSVS